MSPAELLCQSPLVLYRNFLRSKRGLNADNINKYVRSQPMTDADTTLNLGLLCFESDMKFDCLQSNK